jgi:single-strand DNA-binding protein
MGRLTKDPEIKTTNSGNSVVSFNLAVERDYCAKGEERKADFITCVAWRNTAEFISRYFHKGNLISVQGSLQSRSYEDQNGQKRYVTEVNVEKASFTGERLDNGGNNQQQQNGGNGNYQQPQQNGGNGNYQQPQNSGGNYQGNRNNGGYQQQQSNSGYGNNQQQQSNSGYGNNQQQQRNGGYGNNQQPQQYNGGNGNNYQQPQNNGYQPNSQGAFPDDQYPEDDDLPF